jgi:hypothetical protein
LQLRFPTARRRAGAAWRPSARNLRPSAAYVAPFRFGAASGRLARLARPRSRVKLFAVLENVLIRDAAVAARGRLSE